MKKLLLFSLFLTFSSNIFAQNGKIAREINKNEVSQTNKEVERLSFPQEFKLFQINTDAIRQTLLSAPDRFSKTKSNTIISLPNAAGIMEKFEVFEASNFEADLQAQYPNIRSYVGIGIDDKYAQIRLSIDPRGIQTMTFRAGNKNEFMEPYSQDGSVYAVYNSSRTKGKLPFTCSTEDHVVADNININPQTLRASNNVLKTFRLALSCTAEYANYFGATSAAQSGLVLAAYNATMTRVNGLYEKDLAIHLNITANSTNVIYYVASSDPYSNSTGGMNDHPTYNANSNWNIELQNTLGSVIGVANYDIGHLFGADGGGGNAGCIGCVCEPVTTGSYVSNGVTYTFMNGKGMGFTSPADGVPSGDNFDIDYVAHEMGHQFGANHTFSHGIEGTGVNVEPGSGSTIMGYAGITNYDVQSHSDAYFTYRSIAQIQTNLLSKTCSVNTTITHGTPVIDAGLDWTIPKSTPFILTGSGTDSNNDPLTYCWEQNNSATEAFTGVSQTNTTTPNWRSRMPVTTPVRYMPKLASVVSNTLTADYESVSSVARTLNFTLTGRDNVVGGGQTGVDNMVVTVSGIVGPFDVTSQATNGISWTQGSSQTITWAVNGTTALVGSATVDILLSLDGGQTFTTTLASGVTNNGTAIITVPNVAAPFCRVMVKPTGNIYYDINTKDFAIGYNVVNACNTYTDNVPLPFVDQAPGNYTTRMLNIPITGSISDVNVSHSLTHTYLSDVQTDISSPAATATFIKLFNRSCGNTNGTLNMNFTDGGATVNCSGGTTLQNVSPNMQLSAFNGQNPQGNWTFRVYDNFTGDTGTIGYWSVEVCTQTITASTESFGLSDFSLYPNPNNGNFTVQFNSESTNDVNINVHDLRGRQVFAKSYQHNGLFNQTLNLTNMMSGVYLVTVQDGNRKEVKKIVVE